jgi:hypothetical protein
VTVPGKDAGLTLTLQPAIDSSDGEAEACTPDIQGLYWFSDTGTHHHATTETADLVPGTETANPLLATALLIGELCDEKITWHVIWTPEDEEAEDSDPGLSEQGQNLCIFQRIGKTTGGSLSVSAVLLGHTYGPISLTIASSATGDCCPVDITSTENNTNITVFQSGNDTRILMMQIAGTGLEGITFSWTMTTTYEGNKPDLSLFSVGIGGLVAIFEGYVIHPDIDYIIHCVMTWDKCGGGSSSLYMNYTLPAVEES